MGIRSRFGGRFIKRMSLRVLQQVVSQIGPACVRRRGRPADDGKAALRAVFGVYGTSRHGEEEEREYSCRYGYHGWVPSKAIGSFRGYHGL